MKDNLHIVQAGVLKELLFHNGTIFSKLNKDGLSSDHFSFHLKQMIRDELIEKRSGRYYLTPKGLDVAGVLDTESLKLEKQGKVSVIMAGTRMIGDQKQYLLQQRLKEPFFNYWGFMTGKIRFGDSSLDTAKREFHEECGLHGQPKFLGLVHRLRGPAKSDILLDNYFLIYRFENPVGELVDRPEGHNQWLTEKEINKLPAFFPGFPETLVIVRLGKVADYKEEFYRVENISG